MNGFCLINSTTYGISLVGVWSILQEYEPHSDAIHEFPEVYRRPGSLISRIVFELAYHHCSYYGPNVAMLPGVDRGPNATFLDWTCWGYFSVHLGDWGPVSNTLPLNDEQGVRFEMTGILPGESLSYFMSVLWREPKIPWLALEYGSTYR